MPNEPSETRPPEGPPYWYEPGNATNRVCEDYEVLHGPDGFMCLLGEPEDRWFTRDAKPIVAKLNEQHAKLAAAEARCEELRGERDALRAENERLRGLLTDASAKFHEAADDMQGWGEYADDYFKAKWNLAGDVAGLHQFAATIDTALSNAQEARDGTSTPRQSGPMG